MGIALLTLSSLFQGLSALQRMAAPAQAPALRHGHRANVFKSGRPARASGPFYRAASASVLAVRPARPASTAPLRVVRLSESGERLGTAGRMVISGRMADVCAELDRLAERESAALVH
jgi:hypothetical protein